MENCKESSKELVKNTAEILMHGICTMYICSEGKTRRIEGRASGLRPIKAAAQH